jgi:hypothetical protein
MVELKASVSLSMTFTPNSILTSRREGEGSYGCVGVMSNEGIK